MRLDDISPSISKYYELSSTSLGGSNDNMDTKHELREALRSHRKASPKGRFSGT